MSGSALFQVKIRVILKYFVTDCRRLQDIDNLFS